MLVGNESLESLEANFFEKVFKVPKAIRKSKVIGPILATAAAVALIPGVASTIRKGAKLTGKGLGAVAREIAKGGKYLGKSASAVYVKNIKGQIIKYLLPQAEIKSVNKLNRTEITPAIAEGVDLRDIQHVLREGLFPSEVMQEGSKAGLSPSASFSVSQIKKVKEGKIVKALPIIAGATSLGITLLKLKR